MRDRGFVFDHVAAGANAHVNVNSYRSAERAADLLAADEILVAFLDLPSRDAPLVEPGAVRRAQVLDEPGAALAGDGRVLAAHLAGIDDQIAVLAAADQEPILDHPVQLAPVGEEHQRASAGGRGTRLA